MNLCLKGLMSVLLQQRHKEGRTETNNKQNRYTETDKDSFIHKERHAETDV